MKRLSLLILALFLIPGCALLQKSAAPAGPGAQAAANSAEQHKRLAAAVEHLRQGDQKAAVRTLEAIAGAPAVPGVTDEALFRLVLLTLKPTPERAASPQAQQFLKRLVREFPASPWHAQAQPLVNLIKHADELRRQNRSYRNTNQELNSEIRQLNSEIRELTGTIEQLKSLDLELEKKSR